MVNGVPWEVLRPKPSGSAAPLVLALGLHTGLHSPLYPLGFSTHCPKILFFRLAIFNCAMFILSCHNTDIVQYAALQYTSVLNVVRPASWWPIFISMCLLRKLIETCRHCMTLLRKNTETCRPCSAKIQRHVDLAPQKTET